MSRDYINQGAREMKEGRYEEALSSFNRVGRTNWIVSTY